MLIDGVDDMTPAAAYQKEQTDRIERKKISQQCMTVCSLAAQGEVSLEEMHGRTMRMIERKRRCDLLLSIAIAQLKRQQA